MRWHSIPFPTHLDDLDVGGDVQNVGQGNGHRVLRHAELAGLVGRGAAPGPAAVAVRGVARDAAEDGVQDAPLAGLGAVAAVAVLLALRWRVMSSGRLVREQAGGITRIQERVLQHATIHIVTRRGKERHVRRTASLTAWPDAYSSRYRSNILWRAAQRPRHASLSITLLQRVAGSHVSGCDSVLYIAHLGDPDPPAVHPRRPIAIADALDDNEDGKRVTVLSLVACAQQSFILSAQFEGFLSALAWNKCSNRKVPCRDVPARPHFNAQRIRKDF